MTLKNKQIQDEPGRHEWLSGQIHAVRDACAGERSFQRNGRSIGTHFHIVWMNYLDLFLDYEMFCDAIVKRGNKDSEAFQHAKEELEFIRGVR